MAGKALIFCAPSGAGKTTIVKHLLSYRNDLKFSISATTRSPRPYEIDGVDYYFLSKENFIEKVESGEILEWQEGYKGSFYGTLKSEVERIWREGNHVIFDVEVLGGKNLKREFGDRAMSVFIKVNDIDVLIERLEKRNTESSESLQKRVDRAVMEMKEEVNFDEVMINHDLNEALRSAEELTDNFLK